MNLQREIYTEERDGGTYFIPKFVWDEACRLHPRQSSKRGVCKVCGAVASPVFGGMCQDCAIFTTVFDIAKQFGVPIPFRAAQKQALAV
ncbi:MAG: hypothetical protein US74_C0053G0004 [Parcubacteria group bacterium GW2011_GWA2_38_13]|nr:MAG: hypothetical protein US74_C0053G0004 [Parcubacteria group bacterium GW2011_GWA2_38_13]